MDIQRKIIFSAADLARDIGADAIMVSTESGKSYDILMERVDDMDVIVFTPNEETYKELSKDSEARVIELTVRDSSRAGQIRHAVWRGLNNGLLTPGELVVCLTGGMGFQGGADTISVYPISKAESTLAGLIESDPVMNAVVEISTELGWGGRKGEPVGTAFMIGDEEKVFNLSHQLGLNPLKGHKGVKITDSKNWELIKRYAFLDGAFLLDEEGNIMAAGRYLDADVDVDIPSGLGTRHIAVASMSAATHSKGVTVSGTDGMVRIFSDGEILGEIDPRSKMLREVNI